MTRKKTLKLIENLAESLSKDDKMEDAASILFVLAGTIALENKEALSSLCLHNVMWADQTLKAIQAHQKDGGTPPPENKIILPGEEKNE